jgi:hypothetical protein
MILSDYKEYMLQYYSNIEREISRKVQRHTESFTAVSHKLVSRFGLQSKKKYFRFNKVTSLRERKLEEKEVSKYQSYKWLAQSHGSLGSKTFEG